MDFRDRRIWYVVAAIVVLILIGYAAGWFDGEPVPPVIPEARLAAVGADGAARLILRAPSPSLRASAACSEP